MRPAKAMTARSIDMSVLLSRSAPASRLAGSRGRRERPISRFTPVIGERIVDGLRFPSRRRPASPRASLARCCDRADWLRPATAFELAHRALALHEFAKDDQPAAGWPSTSGKLAASPAFDLTVF